MSITINLEDHFTPEQWEQRRLVYLAADKQREVFLADLRDGTVLAPVYVPRHDPPNDTDREWMATDQELKDIYNEGVAQRRAMMAS